MVNEITDVAGSGQKDQLRRQLQKELDSIAARLHRKTEALSTEVDFRRRRVRPTANVSPSRSQMNRELAGRGVLP